LIHTAVPLSEQNEIDKRRSALIQFRLSSILPAYAVEKYLQPAKDTLLFPLQSETPIAKIVPLRNCPQSGSL
jgi:hypothetical protein